MTTCYIASPYTVGDTSENVRNSLNAATRLLDGGMAPFVPLLTHFWDLMHPRGYETWMGYDAEWVLRCDCLLRLPGRSPGADREVDLAKEHGIPVYYDMDELMEDFASGKISDGI